MGGDLGGPTDLHRKARRTTLGETHQAYTCECENSPSSPLNSIGGFSMPPSKTAPHGVADCAALGLNQLGAFSDVGNPGNVVGHEKLLRTG